MANSISFAAAVAAEDFQQSWNDQQPRPVVFQDGAERIKIVAGAPSAGWADAERFIDLQCIPCFVTLAQSWISESLAGQTPCHVGAFLPGMSVHWPIHLFRDQRADLDFHFESWSSLACLSPLQCWAPLSLFAFALQLVSKSTTAATSCYLLKYLSATSYSFVVALTLTRNDSWYS